MILLDTQVLVWFTQGDARLRAHGRKMISTEASGGEVVVSPISFWEVSMLVQRNRISLGMDALDWTTAVLEQPGVRLEPISPTIAIDAGRLPGDIHGDPADRLIVATARHLACPVLTTDRRILEYAAEGHAQAFDAGI